MALTQACMLHIEIMGPQGYSSKNDGISKHESPHKKPKLHFAMANNIETHLPGSFNVWTLGAENSMLFQNSKSIFICAGIFFRSTQCNSILQNIIMLLHACDVIIRPQQQQNSFVFHPQDLLHHSTAPRPRPQLKHEETQQTTQAHHAQEKLELVATRQSYKRRQAIGFLLATVEPLKLLWPSGTSVQLRKHHSSLERVNLRGSTSPSRCNGNQQ